MRTKPVIDDRPVDRAMCTLPTCELVMPPTAGTGDEPAWLTVSIGTNAVVTTVAGLQEYFCSWQHLGAWAQETTLDTKLGVIKGNGAPTADLAAWGRVPLTSREV